MSMSKDVEKNLEKSLAFCDAAAGCDLLFFPEVQLSPFFAQYEKQDASAYLFRPDAACIDRFKQKCREHHLYLSPNLYLDQGGQAYDTTLFLTPAGELQGMAKMVHIFQAEQFYEKQSSSTSLAAMRLLISLVSDTRESVLQPMDFIDFRKCEVYLLSFLTWQP